MLKKIVSDRHSHTYVPIPNRDDEHLSFQNM